MFRGKAAFQPGFLIPSGLFSCLKDRFSLSNGVTEETTEKHNFCPYSVLNAGLELAQCLKVSLSRYNVLLRFALPSKNMGVGRGNALFFSFPGWRYFTLWNNCKYWAWELQAASIASTTLASFQSRRMANRTFIVEILFNIGIFSFCFSSFFFPFLPPRAFFFLSLLASFGIRFSKMQSCTFLKLSCYNWAPYAAFQSLIWNTVHAAPCL